MRPRLTMIFVASATLASCALAPPLPDVPDPPRIIGWKRSDGAAARGPEFDRTKLFCDEYAAAQANTAPNVLMQMVTLQAANKSCMAERGYLAIYDR